MDRHYDPLLFARLRTLFAASDWEGLQAYLDSLSNAQFRTAGYIIGERLLADVSRETFWDVAGRLMLWQPKAFVVTIAKAAARRLHSTTLSLTDDGFARLTKALSDSTHEVDRRKLLAVWLPVVDNYAAMENLFESLGFGDARRRMEFLVHTEGLTAAFVLMRTARYEEHDKEYLTGVCRALIRRASNQTDSRARSLSFNLASLLRSFFDLPDVRGTFSLSTEAYELSRIDTDFDVFCRVVTKV